MNLNDKVQHGGKNEGNYRNRDTPSAQEKVGIGFCRVS
jgi:hypothetical protein